MPTVPHTTPAPRRALLRPALAARQDGRACRPEFDQARLHYYAAPMSADFAGAVLGLEKQFKRWDDITREFARLARRFELQGKAAEGQGRNVTAGDAYFAASVMFSAAQWPIFENTDLNLALERKKTDCYLAYAQRADHHVGAVKVPYGDTTVPGWFHLPPGWAEGAKLPCLVMVSGRDAFEELQIGASTDRFLRRGFAVLMLDGPGQGSCLPRGIWYDPDRYGEAQSCSAWT